MLSHFAPGGYRFLVGHRAPFSLAILADPGLDLVHATFLFPVPLWEGLQAARRHVEAAGRPVVAIGGFELRIPEPLSRDGFDAFNAPYLERLAGMGLASGDGPVAARTNVTPTVAGVREPVLHAFTYTVPSGGRSGPAFRLSGATEPAAEGPADERLRAIVRVLEGRMAELHVGWQDATAVNVYGAEIGARPDLAAALGPAALRGITWFPSLPPIRDYLFEIDVRAAGTEIVL